VGNHLVAATVLIRVRICRQLGEELLLVGVLLLIALRQSWLLWQWRRWR
jgi:hypothetical protein